MDYRTSQSPPQVFGIGLGKTATTSLNEALNILGYKSRHYPLSLHYINNGTYNAATDTLIALEYKNLQQTFPKAKFIYTLRNKRQWLDSFEDHFKKDDVIRLFKNFAAMGIRRRLYGTCSFDRDIYSEKFSEHLSEVLDHFRNNMDNLLILNIIENSSQDNWTNLCKFLSCKEPENVEFPYLNKK